MYNTIRDSLLIIICCLLLTFSIWLPFYLRLSNFYNLNFSQGFSTIYQNFDGLEYVIIAKTFYSPHELAKIAQDKKPNYYPSHFPGFPAAIAALAPYLGYLKSMLIVTQIFTILSAIAFYLLIKNFKLTSSPLTLSLIFLILPARWIIVHSVGSPEPMFIFLTIISLYFFLLFEKSGKLLSIFLSAIFGALALTVRPPGILLAIALAVFYHLKAWEKFKASSFVPALKLHIKYLPLILIPLSLLGIFYLFQIQLNDFWAYFHSGDNIHLTFPPFQVFNKSQFWVGDIWLEDLIYIFILGFLGGLLLLKNQATKPLGFYVLTFMIAGISIAHRDISRYLLPIAPFVLIAFEKVLVSKEFKIIAVILLLGLYLYSQNYILNNTAPFSDLNLLN